MHVFQCAACDARFESGKRENRCPQCGASVLIHVSGEQFKSKCCGGSCGGCSGCGR